jgi:hypothetical protein
MREGVSKAWVEIPSITGSISSATEGIPRIYQELLRSMYR